MKFNEQHRHSWVGSNNLFCVEWMIRWTRHIRSVACDSRKLSSHWERHPCVLGSSPCEERMGRPWPLPPLIMNFHGLIFHRENKSIRMSIKNWQAHRWMHQCLNVSVTGGNNETSFKTGMVIVCVCVCVLPGWMCVRDCRGKAWTYTRLISANPSRFCAVQAD